MVTIPADAPVTTPVVVPTEAIVEELLVQVPPPVASASVMKLPTHKFVAPVIAAGALLTVTKAMAAVPQPVA